MTIIRHTPVSETFNSNILLQQSLAKIDATTTDSIPDDFNAHKLYGHGHGPIGPEKRSIDSDNTARKAFMNFLARYGRSYASKSDMDIRF